MYKLIYCIYTQVNLQKQVDFDEENSLTHQNDSDRLRGYGWEEPDRTGATGTAEFGEA